MVIVFITWLPKSLGFQNILVEGHLIWSLFSIIIAIFLWPNPNKVKLFTKLQSYCWDCTNMSLFVLFALWKKQDNGNTSIRQTYEQSLKPNSNSWNWVIFNIFSIWASLLYTNISIIYEELYLNQTWYCNYFYHIER